MIEQQLYNLQKSKKKRLGIDTKSKEGSSNNYFYHKFEKAITIHTGWHKIVLNGNFVKVTYIFYTLIHKGYFIVKNRYWMLNLKLSGWITQYYISWIYKYLSMYVYVFLYVYLFVCLVCVSFSVDWCMYGAKQ